MISWLAANLATILVGLLLLVCVALVIRKLIRDRRAGRHACGCDCGGCSGCAMHGSPAGESRSD